jgi:DNA-binding NtrC family response regulator
MEAVDASRRNSRTTCYVVLPAVTDEDVTGRSSARLLITASTQRGVETLARRIHEAGPRAQFPFIHKRARHLPIEPEALGPYCSSVLDAAAGGSILISAVEEMPLARLELARCPSAAVRLMSGTTVSLRDRVAARTFSARLFYRLNVIHLMARDGSADVPLV